MKVNAKTLLPPKILFGADNVIDDSRVASFQLKFPVYETAKEIKWAVLYFRDMHIGELVKTFQSFSKTLHLKMSEPKEYNLGDANPKAGKEIEYIL